MLWIVLLVLGFVVLLAVLAPAPRRVRPQADADRPWLVFGPGALGGSDGGPWGGDGGSGGDGGGGGGP